MSEKTKEPTQAEKEIISIFEHITAKLKPANPETATETFTTTEFAKIIREHYPAARDLSDDTVYDLLKDNDYQYELINGSIYWLVNAG